jgi:hypothetical protein
MQLESCLFWAFVIVAAIALYLLSEQKDTENQNPTIHVVIHFLKKNPADIHQVKEIVKL